MKGWSWQGAKAISNSGVPYRLDFWLSTLPWSTSVKVGRLCKSEVPTLDGLHVFLFRHHAGCRMRRHIAPFYYLANHSDLLVLKGPCLLGLFVTRFYVHH